MVSAIGLGACGGGGNADPAPPSPGEDLASRNFLPVAVGNRWLYTDTSSPQTVLIKSTGTRQVAGAIGVVAVSSDAAGDDAVRVADSSGVYELPGTNADPLTLAVGRIPLLKYPLRVGDSFVQADKAFGTTFDFGGDAVGDAATLRSSVQVVALEDALVFRREKLSHYSRNEAQSGLALLSQGWTLGLDAD